MVEVVQADREAANIGIVSPDKVLRGDLDDHPLVQALAKHRLAYTPNTGLSDERARDLLVQPMDNAGAFNPREIVVSLDDALRAMQQYAAGLRDGLEQIATATNDTDASILRYVARTALGDTQS